MVQPSAKRKICNVTLVLSSRIVNLISLEFQDVKGIVHQFEAEEMMSICLQHEIDHLNGILFIDHLPALKQKMVKKKLKKLAMANA